MNFRSILGKSPSVGFRDALFRGIAPDGSLYIPEELPALPFSFLTGVENRTLHEIGFRVTSAFIDEIPPADLQGIVHRAWDFPIPLVKLEDGLYLLELFHGPTLAFKDVGARFMAHALSFFLAQERRRLFIVVATSGDTGSAVAHGFFNVPHITVFILYPSGKISTLQEQQMTTLGHNIYALEVEGTFDDCQQLVKQALADPDLTRAHNLTTANSINLGRLIPQIAYYVWAAARFKLELQQVEVHKDLSERPVIAVPSGNFGNLTAAAYSKSMGNPIGRLVAATNENSVVPDYFRSGLYSPRPSRQTYSNAMDVGNPSNFVRIQALYNYNLHRMKNDISAVSISDDETLAEIRRTYEQAGYVLDPHSAVGVAAARAVRREADRSASAIVTATAHPGKFPDVVAKALNMQIPLPLPLQEALNRPKMSMCIRAEYPAWKEILLQHTS
ncbi:MAG: threonine synthase [Ignavibacteria bacterium]|nr:threonine synthase [Ignavibacteria bacterium]